MTKSDLKTGMIVVTRDNHIYTVMRYVYIKSSSQLRDILISDNSEYIYPLYNYNDDLTLCGSDCADIMGVYVPEMLASLVHKDMADEYYWKCVWKREEPPVEMTVAEIEEKLGIKNLKIIKEHEDE